MAKVGDVFAFPIDDLGDWGLCQAVDAFTYDEAERVLDASFSGQPMVTLAFCDGVNSEAPKLSDFGKAKLLVLSYARWKDEEKLINVSARVPADFVLLGAAPLIAKLAERCRKWAPGVQPRPTCGFSMNGMPSPKEQTQAFREARNSTEKVAIPGVTDMNGRPVMISQSLLQALRIPRRPTLKHVIFVFTVRYTDDLVEEFIAQGTALIDVEPDNLNGLNSRQIKLQGFLEHIKKQLRNIVLVRFRIKCSNDFALAMIHA
jgi:hypothetical protein